MNAKKFYIYFLLTTSFLTASDLKYEQNGHNISIVNTQDVICYLNNFSDQFVVELRQHYDGLKDEKRLDNLLRAQNYIEVLNYLWSEEDQNKRIQWLEKKYKESHPILLFELAKEYSFKDPSLNTYILRSSPLISMANCRVCLDCTCTTDESVSAGVGFLESIYREFILEKLHSYYSTDEIVAFAKKHYDEFWTNKKNCIKQILIPFLEEKKMPSPKWIFPHGLYGFYGEVEDAAFPEKDWVKNRKKTAEEILQSINEIDAEFMKDPAGFIEKEFEE